MNKGATNLGHPLRPGPQGLQADPRIRRGHLPLPGGQGAGLLNGRCPRTITMSRGRQINLSGPQYYQDLLTGIALEILNELSELEKLDLTSMGEDAFDQVVSITQIRLLNELYYGLGQLRAQGAGARRQNGHPGPRDIWNRYIDSTNRPAALKFQIDAEDEQVQ